MFIMDHGRRAHVLLTNEAYQRLTHDPPPAGFSIADMLAFNGEISDDLDKVLEDVREASRRDMAVINLSTRRPSAP